MKISTNMVSNIYITISTNLYIIILVDFFSKYCISKATKDYTAIDELISKFVPFYILPVIIEESNQILIASFAKSMV